MKTKNNDRSIFRSPKLVCYKQLSNLKRMEVFKTENENYRTWLEEENNIVIIGKTGGQNAKTKRASCLLFLPSSYAIDS